MVTTDLEQAIQDRHATAVSIHTNVFVSRLQLHCSAQHFHFQIPELHFFFRKGLIHAAVSRGRKMKQLDRKRKTDHIKEGPSPKASTLILLSLTGIKVPASTSRDTWLLRPRLLEYELLHEQAGTARPLCNPPQQTEQTLRSAAPCAKMQQTVMARVMTALSPLHTSRIAPLALSRMVLVHTPCHGAHLAMALTT